MSKAARIGRPMKSPARGEKRISLGLKVTAEVKRRIDSAARATGRTQSQEAERRIEMSYTYERAIGELDSARAALGEISQANAEQVLERLGWNSIVDLRYGGAVWLPPGRLEIEQTRWVDPDDRTPPAPPKIIPDPEFVKAVAQPIIEAIRAGLLEQGRGS